jgi:hypothetical protein
VKQFLFKRHFYSERKVHMNTNQKDVGWGFWLAWVLASIMGFGMGALLGMSVAYGLFDRDVFDATIGITAGIVMGATGSYVQWVVLREHIARAGWWVLAGALGFAITLGTLGAIGISENYVMAGILFAAVFGIAGGSYNGWSLGAHGLCELACGYRQVSSAR